MQRFMLTSLVLALSAGFALAQTATPNATKEIKVNYGAAGGMKLDPTTTGGTTAAPAKECPTGQQANSTTASSQAANAPAPKC